VEQSGAKWIIFRYLAFYLEEAKMATFIGDYACKVDVKGRIILPMAFKKRMPSDAQDHFVVRKDIFENCLVLYSIEDWNRQLRLIRKGTSRFKREDNTFVRNFFKDSAELSLDNNNRILVPKKLMDLIGAGRDVVLAGQDGRIEIWEADAYEKIGMAAEDFAALAENLMGEINNEPEG
jgi:MraZ protein